MISYTAGMPPPVRQSLLTEDMTHTSVSENCTYANWKTIPVSAASGYVGSGGVADDVLSFDDVPPDLSFEDLERTFSRFSRLEGLREYRV
ncbi:uncharacterized protein DS421_20g695890 [Arachis hypogaea]|nr:uncharacterized protein DS421_20g695890 [Arachis hypogaea]